MPRLCSHPEAQAEACCPNCLVRVETCPGCNQLHRVDPDGTIESHSPPPMRMVCAGAGYSSIERVAAAKDRGHA